VSTLVVGVLVAIVLAGAVGFYVHWARSQASRLPSKLLEPCPLVVQGVQNASSHVLFVVFNGDMGSNETVFVVVAKFTGSPPSIAWEYFPVSDRPGWTDSYYGFESFYSTNNPSASGFTNRVFFNDISEMPYVNTLSRSPQNYFAMRYTLAVSPRSTGNYTFTIECIGACDLLVVDALTGASKPVVGVYTKSWSSQVSSNTSATSLYAGRVYAIVARHASWTQNSTLRVYINGTPLMDVNIPLLAYGLDVNVLAIPGQRGNTIYSTTLDSIPLYYSCRGYIGVVQR
jgi:hypothetical protein